MGLSKMGLTFGESLGLGIEQLIERSRVSFFTPIECTLIILL